VGSENIFDNLKPLKDELGLGRDLLVEVCKKLKINFLEHTMEDDDDGVSIGFWPRHTVPVVLGVHKDSEGGVVFKGEAQCLPFPESKRIAFLKDSLSIAHSSFSNISAPGDGWLYSCENKRASELTSECIIEAVQRITTTSLYLQKTLSQKYSVIPPNIKEDNWE
tara:strand:+ start:330 stop:824 length:495 start_codon:yes stop_codon:yes gene_type:complete